MLFNGIPNQKCVCMNHYSLQRQCAVTHEQNTGNIMHTGQADGSLQTENCAG